MSNTKKIKVKDIIHEGAIFENTEEDRHHGLKEMHLIHEIDGDYNIVFRKDNGDSYLQIRETGKPTNESNFDASKEDATRFFLHYDSHNRIVISPEKYPDHTLTFHGENLIIRKWKHDGSGWSAIFIKENPEKFLGENVTIRNTQAPVDLPFVLESSPKSNYHVILRKDGKYLKHTQVIVGTRLSTVEVTDVKDDALEFFISIDGHGRSVIRAVSKPELTLVPLQGGIVLGEWRHDGSAWRPD